VIILVAILLANFKIAQAMASDSQEEPEEIPAIFVNGPSPLSAAQSAGYAEAQSVAQEDPAFSAVGADKGEGITGLEVLGILFLVGLATTGIVVAVAANS
jgi:hypothetical protein